MPNVAQKRHFRIQALTKCSFWERKCLGWCRFVQCKRVFSGKWHFRNRSFWNIGIKICSFWERKCLGCNVLSSGIGYFQESGILDIVYFGIPALKNAHFGNKNV